MPPAANCLQQRHLEKLFQVLPRKAALATTENNKYKMENCNKLSIRENCVPLQGKHMVIELNKNQNTMKK